jgi:hypothetical protein
MQSSDRAHTSSCDEPLVHDGFITDAEWLNFRLSRARARVGRLEIAFAAARVSTPEWVEAERQLRFAREEVDAYDAYLRELTS